MNTAAIYTVRQYGRDSHFYSYCAGGFSYPFLVMDRLTKANTALNEAVRGLHLFRAVRDSEAAAHLGRTAEDERIPFHITLDLDRETVGFEFNRNLACLTSKCQ